MQIEDEPTGGTHLTLVLSGTFSVSLRGGGGHQAGLQARHREILPVVRPVVEKMACHRQPLWIRPTRTPFTSAAAPAASQASRTSSRR